MARQIVYATQPKRHRRKRAAETRVDMPIIIGRSMADRAADYAETMRRADESKEVWAELVRRATLGADEDTQPGKLPARVG
jgi:hypothetical protein